MISDYKLLILDRILNSEEFTPIERCHMALSVWNSVEEPESALQKGFRYIQDQEKKKKEYLDSFKTKTACQKEIRVINQKLSELDNRRWELTSQGKDTIFLEADVLALEEDRDYLKIKANRKVPLNIEEARMVPIPQFIEFSSAGFAKCLWHDERTPSMRYYKDKNVVHCFGGCGTKDVIEVVKALHQVDFNRAVEILKGK